jgi:hypothetical protein
VKVLPGSQGIALHFLASHTLDTAGQITYVAARDPMRVTKYHILETILCGSSQGCCIYSTFVKLESRVHPSTTATLHSCPVEVTQPCLTLDTLKLALHQALLHCNVQTRCINYYTGISSTHTARIEVCQLYKLYLQLVIEHTTQQIVGL